MSNITQLKTFLANVRHAIRSHECVTIGGGEFSGSELKAVANALTDSIAQAEALATAKPAVINETPFSKFLGLLAMATYVTVDGSPKISTWDTDCELSEPDNQVVRFEWEDESYVYATCLTERGITEGRFEHKTFYCKDHEGDEVEIKFFQTVQLTV